MDDRSVDRARALAGAACAFTAAIAAHAPAITINVNYDPTQPGAVDPAFDLFGAQLTPIVNYAASFYEDVFEDVDHTITLTFWYTDLPDNQLGNHDNLTDDANGREQTGTLRFDLQNTSGVARTYFYDATPGDNAEYAMAQTFWEDLSSAQQQNFYNAGGSAPDTFEVGYFGAAASGPASAGIDMLTLVLHEMGHALGMSGGIPTTVAETMDGDYDFNPDWVFGAALAADNIDQATDFVGHLDDPNNLMFPSLSIPGGGTTGVRKLPSHADLFSMASGHQYGFIDVPRREFYGGNNFNLDANWSGDNTPEFNDEAFVRTGGDVFLFAGANVAALHIERGTDLSTANSNLTVNGLLAVENTAGGPASRLIVNEATVVEAEEVLVGINSAIVLDSANLTAGHVQTLNAVTPGTIRGAGTVQVTGTFNNNGVVRPEGGTLSLFTISAAPVWDLDGASGAGGIDATGGDLFVTGALTDAFDGNLTIGPTRNATFNSGFHLGAAGEAAVNGSLTTNFGTLQIDGTLQLANLGLITPTINGSAPVVVGADGALATAGDAVVATPLTVAGNLITGLGAADFNGTVNIQSTAAVVIGLGGLIRFNDAATLGGGDFAGLGNAHFNADATVNGDTVVDLLTVDLDGAAGVTAWTLTRGLTLNVDHIDTNANDTFNGTLNLNGLFPALAVNLSDPFAAWTMAGTMNLEGNGMFFGATQVAGSIVNITGDVNVDGLTRISATTLWDGELTFEDADAVLRLEASTRTHHINAGASITGPGTLAVGLGAALQIADGVTIESNLQNAGTLAPGSSPGDIVVALDFEQTANGVLVMELGGEPRSGLFDTLTVTGEMSLDGTLNVALIDGFMPTVGDTFDLLDWGTLVGTFAQINLPRLDDGVWNTRDLYATGELHVAIPEPAAALLLTLGALSLLHGGRRRA